MHCLHKGEKTMNPLEYDHYYPLPELLNRLEQWHKETDEELSDAAAVNDCNPIEWEAE
jgi:hypothetical protein